MTREEAINEIKSWAIPSERGREVLETLIPELKEGEDERIRTELLSSFKGIMADADEDELWYGLPYNDIIAWLEKQKEKPLTIESAYEKFVNSETLKEAKENKYIRAQLLWELMHNGIITEVDYQYLTDDKRKPWTAEEYSIAYQKGFDMSEQLKQEEQKVSVDDFKAKDWYVSKVDGKIHNIYYSVDKVKPKFKVGDKIIEKDFDECGRGTIIDIKDGKYIFDDGGFICIEEQGLWKLVEQKPAEWSEEDENQAIEGIIPILKDVAYQGSFGNPNQETMLGFARRILKSLRPQPKQEWGGEDEEMFFFINELLENKGRDYFTTLVYDAVQNWLKNRFKSLRPQPKKELSIEKAIQWLDDTFYFLDNSSGRGRDCEITTHDFDSLEEMYDSFRKAVTVDAQPSWKPSEEQMEAMERASTNKYLSAEQYDILVSLYEQLKKLI